MKLTQSSIVFPDFLVARLHYHRLTHDHRKPHDHLHKGEIVWAHMVNDTMKLLCFQNQSYNFHLHHFSALHHHPLKFCSFVSFQLIISCPFLL